MKFCKYCKQEKLFDLFSLDKKSKDGRQSKCKQCFSEYMKKRTAQKSKEINEKRRIQYAKQIEKKRAQTRASYEKHKEKRLAYAKEYISKPENKLRRKETHKNWKKNKLKSDPLFLLKYRISSLFRMALKLRGYGKTTKVAQTLGCTWQELLAHIERQFLKGMTWDNRYLWHIDHIVPLATAKTEDDVIRLNHYTNLRPMWAIDNLKKGAKMENLL